MKVYNSRLAGRVRRYHTCRMICPQDVAQHSFNVCNLVRLLGGSMYAQLAAIHHDMGEYACSDVPSPVKRALGPQAKAELEIMESEGMAACGVEELPLNEQDTKILKVADNLEGLITCIEEVRMGNQDLVAAGWRYAEYLRGQDMLHKLVKYYLDRWGELPK